MAQTTTAKPAVVLAAFSEDTGSQVSRALASAAGSYQTAVTKAERDVLGATRKAALMLSGIALTEAQWAKQLAPKVTKALSAKVAASTVASALSRSKRITLAALARPKVWAGDTSDPKVPHWSDPLSGENAKSYLERIASFLDNAKHEDGTWVMTHTEAGELPPKSGKSRKEPAAPKSAADVADDEGGLNIPAALAASRILFPTDDETAQRLVIIAESFPERFAKWAADMLQAEADTAVTRAKERANK